MHSWVKWLKGGMLTCVACAWPVDRCLRSTARRSVNGLRCRWAAVGWHYLHSRRLLPHLTYRDAWMKHSNIWRRVEEKADVKIQLH